MAFLVVAFIHFYSQKTYGERGTDAMVCDDRVALGFSARQASEGEVVASVA